jgi:hypothetical protein
MVNQPLFTGEYFGSRKNPLHVVNLVNAFFDGDDDVRRLLQVAPTGQVYIASNFFYRQVAATRQEPSII